MSWSDALRRARGFATERGVRYAVFAHRLNGRWIWYAKPVDHMATQMHRRERS